MKKEEKWTATFQKMSKEISEWRGKKKKATFSEIENRLDEKLSELRVEMLEDLALESEMRAFKDMPKGKRPKCSVCGKELASNGSQTRIIKTSYEKEVKLKRSKGYCQSCKTSLFPPG